MRSLASRIAVFVLLICATAASSFAQGGRAEINGTVVDQSQAVLPGVTVTVVNAGTSIERVVVTGPDGRFVVPTLVPGVYTVSVELAGFQPQTRENVRVSVGQEVTLDFTLGVGGLAEEVTVTRGGADRRGDDHARGDAHQQRGDRQPSEPGPQPALADAARARA